MTTITNATTNNKGTFPLIHDPHRILDGMLVLRCIFCLFQTPIEYHIGSQSPYNLKGQICPDCLINLGRG
jgi:hypothetical protein